MSILLGLTSPSRIPKGNSWNGFSIALGAEQMEPDNHRLEARENAVALGNAWLVLHTQKTKRDFLS